MSDIGQDLAEHGEPSLSAWLSDAARLKLRRRRLEQLVGDFERAQGRITEAELAEVRVAWPEAGPLMPERLSRPIAMTVTCGPISARR